MSMGFNASAAAQVTYLKSRLFSMIRRQVELHGTQRRTG
jgi:hypothetical protein